jgi:hypothetical protein
MKDLKYNAYVISKNDRKIRPNVRISEIRFPMDVQQQSKLVRVQKQM